MSENKTSGESPSPRDPSNWPADVAATLKDVQSFLDRKQVQDALASLGRNRTASPWLQNAQGVCQLRLGNINGAIEIFARLVLSNGGVVVRRDVPTIFLANYATALLASGNLPGCQWILNEIQEKSHPSAERVRDAIKRWRAGLTLWQRFLLALNGETKMPPVLDFPLGDLG